MTNVQSSIDLIQKYLDAFNQEDKQGMLDCLSDQVIHDVNEGKREIGKEAFAKFLDNAMHYYREVLHDIELMVNSTGSRVATEFNVAGTYVNSCEGLPESTGQEYTLPAGIFFEVESNEITRVTTYYNLNHWLEQVR